MDSNVKCYPSPHSWGGNSYSTILRFIRHVCSYSEAGWANASVPHSNHVLVHLQWVKWVLGECGWKAFGSREGCFWEGEGGTKGWSGPGGGGITNTCHMLNSIPGYLTLSSIYTSYPVYTNTHPRRPKGVAGTCIKYNGKYIPLSWKDFQPDPKLHWMQQMPCILALRIHTF